MLRAHLERKLARFFVKALPELAEDEALFDRRLRSALSASEDALTSSVLERLSYLPLTLLWSLLQRACVTRQGPLVLPCPQGEPRWRFWPSLPPAQEGDGSYVEPDALLQTPTHALLIECKHHDQQSRGQWLRQIDAFLHQQRGGAVPTACVIHLALGGSEAEWHQQAQDGAAFALGPNHVQLAYLSWTALASAIDALCRSCDEPGQRRLLEATRDALVAFGYPPRRWLASLPGLRIRADARRVLAAPVIPRRPIGFAGLPLPSLSASLRPWRSR